MIDKKGKLFGKISIIDIILILIIFAVVIGVGLKMMNFGQSAQIKADTSFYVTFRVNNVREFTVNAVKEGDVFYEKNGPRLGVVSNVYSKPNEAVISKVDGSSLVAQTPEKYDLFITLQCEGKEDDIGFYVNGTKQVASGMDIKLKSNQLNCDSIVDFVGYEQKVWE